MNNVDIVVDAGNSRVKAVLIKDNKIVDTISVPSSILYVDSPMGLSGECIINGVTSILGESALGVSGGVNLVDDSKGKLTHLKGVLGGVLSLLSSDIPNNSTIRFHVLTLYKGSEQQIRESLQGLNSIVIDGEQRTYTVELDRVLPEGYGACLSTMKEFKGSKELMVLDIGGGTVNLSKYRLSGNVPKRTYFDFRPLGTSILMEMISEEARQETTNGKVDRLQLERQLITNSKGPMDGYISRGLDSWCDLFMESVIYSKLYFDLTMEVPLVVCGGGVKLELLKKSLNDILSKISPKASFVRDPEIIGIVGVAKQILADV